MDQLGERDPVARMRLGQRLDADGKCAAVIGRDGRDELAVPVVDLEGADLLLACGGRHQFIRDGRRREPLPR